VVERIFKYYLGVIECQFELLEIDQPTIRSVNGQHRILLQPKFRFFDFHEITEVDFNESLEQIRLGKYLKHNNLSVIDFVPKNQNDIIAKEFDLAYLTFETETTPKLNKLDNESTSPEASLWEETFIASTSIDNYKFSLPLSPFLVNNKDYRHGRLHARCCIRTFEEIEIPDTPQIPISNVSQPTNDPTFKKCDYLDKDTLIQCDNLVAPDVQFCPLHDNVINNPVNDGCFTDGCFGGVGGTRKLWNNYLTPIGLDYTNSRGCFNGQNTNPLGCFSTGVPVQSRLGCGLGSLLGLIALLWLLACLLFGQCGGCKEKTSKTISNPDTVYVEVFRELKDTLKIVKNFVDSNTTHNYEMVSLPYVQFFTDSDKLLPSSTKELQTLAEYLIKNDSLQATILGHTDNLGDSKSKLELSQRRAESVKKFLVSIGVKESNLSAVGKGDTQPKAPNTTKEGRLMNRRVEVKLQQNQISTTKRVELSDSLLMDNE